MGRTRIAVVRVLAVIAVLTVASLAHAALSLYTAPNAQYVGHWTWNDYDTNTSEVDVRMKAKPPKKPQEQKAAPRVCIQNFKVEVGALAEDGTFVKRYELVQVPLGATREVTLRFDRTLTSLDFIKILALPGGGAGCES
jgi:hypothetical protein